MSDTALALARRKPSRRAPDAPWAAELGPLASQHHLSEYNRLKHGQRGSPVSYAPLSLHLPDIVRTLRERQQKHAGHPLWWPCPPSAPAIPQSSPVIPAASQRAALATGETIPLPDLQRQLSIAISDSIPRPQPDCPPLHAKTSETHPINVSQIIPPESLAAISSHLIPCKKPCPVLFEFICPDPMYPQLFPPDVLPTCPVPVLSSSRSSLTGALNVALNSKTPLPAPSSRILLSLRRTFRNHTVSDASSERAIPKPPHRQSSLPPTLTTSQFSHNTLPPFLALPIPYALHPFSSHVGPHIASSPSPPNKYSKPRSFSPSLSSARGSSNRGLKLGNLLLSSCPGKKVRLSGPVHGRSAVCRDLDVDLRRMKMLGARCVVCCLDDEELEFLVGTSWSEYRQVAHQEGLDVLRIPLPEGLAPLSPKALDIDLNWIIERYTMHGMSVLVHCRGGVGRAGLFACCWMLKLGLCGWIESDAAPSPAAPGDVPETKHEDTPSGTIRWDGKTVVRRDTLQMVERAIEVVRRRRSAKAIETLEQVQFLVEYVNYLRDSGREFFNWTPPS